jgi:hypothetical protein
MVKYARSRVNRGSSRSKLTSARSISRTKRVTAPLAKAKRRLDSAKGWRLAAQTYAKRGQPVLAAAANAKAIAKLNKQVKANKRQLDGEYQTKTGGSEIMQLNYKAPLCLHLNNLNIGARNTTASSLNAEGPQWIRAHFNNGDLISTSNQLLGHENVRTARMAPLDHANPMCNGPKCRWLGTELQFEFTGYVNDCHIGIYVVQEKPGPRSDPWGAIKGTNSPPVHLPYTLNQWKELEDFGPHRINYQRYRVIAKKKLYMNSRVYQQNETTQDVGDAVGADIADDEARVDATTRPIKRCAMKLRPNKMLYQIQSSQTETGTEKMDADGNARESHTQGPWSFDNQLPLSNWWVIITTDNRADLPTTIESVGLGHSHNPYSGNTLTVEVIRRNWWQDSHKPSLIHTDLGGE